MTAAIAAALTFVCVGILATGVHCLLASGEVNE
jgi:hypothetical protein